MAHGLLASRRIVGGNLINYRREVCPENQFFISVSDGKGYEVGLRRTLGIATETESKSI
jgi:hypothetical protein